MPKIHVESGLFPPAQSGMRSTDGPLMLARASGSRPARAAGANMSAATSGVSVSRVTVPLKVGMMVSMLMPKTLQRFPPLGKRP